MSNTAKTADVARQRADWMMPVDDEILEHLRDEKNLTPMAFQDLGVATANYAGDRCRTLAKYGLVETWSRGLYRLTDQGHAYLDEKLDASTLEISDAEE